MKKFGEFLRHLFRYHKLKFVFVLVAALFFFGLLFPYDDLSDLMTTKISEATQNQVYVQADQLGLSFFPPSLALDGVSVDTPSLPTLKAERLWLAPSVAGLLTFKPGFSATASGFLQGDVALSVRGGSKAPDGGIKQVISLEIEKLDLSRTKDLADLPVQFKGAANLKSDLVVDPNFTDQPEGDLNINVSQLEIPPSTLPTPFGPVSFPALKWTSLNLKGRMAGSKFIIDEGQLGTSQDPFHGQIKGQMDVRFARRGGAVQPDFGAYDLKIELNLNKGMEKDLGLFLSLVDGFKSSSPNGSRYLFKASGSRFGVPPRFSNLPNFN